MRKDSSRISVVALDLVREHHMVIWAVDGLPTDAVRLQQVPRAVSDGSRAIGGVLVFCASSLLHVNQGGAVFAMTVNSFADNITRVPSSQGCYFFSTMFV